jgi:hypothetical protein
MRKLYTIGVICALLCTVTYADKKYPMTAASIVPGARAELEIGTDRNGNTSLKMKVQHLAHSENLTPHAEMYIVWLQERGGTVANIGRLRVDKNLNAEFESVTSSKSFDLVVTAEQELRTTSPSGSEVLRATVQQ